MEVDMVNCIVTAESCLHRHKCYLQAALGMDGISNQNRTVASSFFFFFFQLSSYDFVFRINIAVCAQAAEVL